MPSKCFFLLVLVLATSTLATANVEYKFGSDNSYFVKGNNCFKDLCRYGLYQYGDCIEIYTLTEGGCGTKLSTIYISDEPQGKSQFINTAASEYLLYEWKDYENTYIYAFDLSNPSNPVQTDRLVLNNGENYNLKTIPQYEGYYYFNTVESSEVESEVYEIKVDVAGMFSQQKIASFTIPSSKGKAHERPSTRHDEVVGEYYVYLSMTNYAKRGGKNLRDNAIMAYPRTNNPQGQKYTVNLPDYDSGIFYTQLSRVGDYMYASMYLRSPLQTNLPVYSVHVSSKSQTHGTKINQWQGENLLFESFMPVNGEEGILSMVDSSTHNVEISWYKAEASPQTKSENSQTLTVGGNYDRGYCTQAVDSPYFMCMLHNQPYRETKYLYGYVDGSGANSTTEGSSGLLTIVILFCCVGVLAGFVVMRRKNQTHEQEEGLLKSYREF